MVTAHPTREAFFSWPKARRAALVAQLYEGGLAARRISKLLQIGQETVYRLLRAAKVPRRPAGARRLGFSPAFRAQVVEAYVGGRGVERVGKRFGISPRQVLNILKEAGVQIRPPGAARRPPTGPREEAIRLREQGLSFSKIAAALGLNHPQTAWRLVNKKVEKTAP